MQKLLLHPSPPDFLLKYKGAIPFLGALFIAFFLLSFQPFQYRFYSWETKGLVTLAYMMITFLVLALSLWGLPKIRPHWFVPGNWTIKKECFLIGLNLLGISLGVFLFKVSFGFYAFSIERLATGLIASIAIGILPTTIYKLASIAYVHGGAPIHSPELVPALNQQEQPLIFEADRGDHCLHLDPANIIAIEVQKNYLLFFHMKEGTLHTDRLRNRMYYAEQVLENEAHLLRCHRAFMVNQHFILDQQLNTHGGHLSLKGLDAAIPVSRKYASLFLE